MDTKYIPSDDAGALCDAGKRVTLFKIRRVVTLLWMYVVVQLAYGGLIAYNELVLIDVRQYFARESDYFSITWFWFAFLPILLAFYALLGIQPFVRVFVYKKSYLKSARVLSRRSIDKVSMSMILYIVVFLIALAITAFYGEHFGAFMMTLLFWGVCVHKGFEIAAAL